MGEEQIDKVEKATIEVPEISSVRQALVLLWSVMDFFLSNYKKTTLITIALIVFLLTQLSSNFEQVQAIAKLFGL